MTQSAKIHVLQESNHLRALHAVMRRAEASQSDFDGCANLGLRRLLGESLAQLPHRPGKASTPLSLVSVVRDADSPDLGLSTNIRDLATGRIVIERENGSRQPSFHSAYLPQDIAEGFVLLLNSNLMTGASAAMAVEVLVGSGVPVENIVLANIHAAQKALDRLTLRHPNLTIVTASIEQEPGDDTFMIPVISDFAPTLRAA